MFNVLLHLGRFWCVCWIISIFAGADGSAMGALITMGVIVAFYSLKEMFGKISEYLEGHWTHIFLGVIGLGIGLWMAIAIIGWITDFTTWLGSLNWINTDSVAEVALVSLAAACIAGYAVKGAIAATLDDRTIKETKESG